MRFAVVASLYTYLMWLWLPWIETKATTHQRLGKHFLDQIQKNDKKSQTYEQKVFLYAEVNGKCVQILKRHVNAKATKENQNAILVIETASFGVVRIRSFTSPYYLCMNSKGIPVGMNKTRGHRIKRCRFKVITTPQAIQYVSMKFPLWSLAFTKKGDPKSAKRVLNPVRSVANKFRILYPKPKVKEKTKRNVRERTKHRHTNGGVCRRRILTDKERKRQCFNAALCLRIQKAPRWRRKVLQRCRRFFRRKCR